ncbi:uncharacterized protein LOC144635666 [Oculina patagonica]
MAFAKDYKEEITLAYYCFSLALTIAVLIFGTIYLWYRDRRDQQRREWRQFAERIYSEYNSKLKAKDIPRKVSKVRDTFQKIRMNSTISGLDVLRYMLTDSNYERSKTTQLECLREDLLSIFQLFNVCYSLLLLGKIPKNIKEELTDVVTELGDIALPFFKGKQRKIILKCLEHFANGRLKPKTERKVRDPDLDARLEETVPYITSCLWFGSHDDSAVMIRIMRQVCSDYSKCSDFSLDVKVFRQGINQVNLTFLTELHEDLRDPRYLAEFARKLREHPVQLIFEQRIKDDDDEDDVLMKVLHEVRFYIHLYLNKNQLGERREKIEDNVRRLRDVKEEATRLRSTEAIVEGICKQTEGDLQRLRANSYLYNFDLDFCEQLQQLQDQLWAILRTRRTNPNQIQTTV